MHSNSNYGNVYGSLCISQLLTGCKNLQSNPIQHPKSYVKLEVPTLEPHTLHATDVGITMLRNHLTITCRAMAFVTFLSSRIGPPLIKESTSQNLDTSVIGNCLASVKQNLQTYHCDRFTNFPITTRQLPRIHTLVVNKQEP